MRRRRRRSMFGLVIGLLLAVYVEAPLEQARVDQAIAGVERSLKHFARQERRIGVGHRETRGPRRAGRAHRR